MTDLKREKKELIQNKQQKLPISACSVCTCCAVRSILLD